MLRVKADAPPRCIARPEAGPDLYLTGVPRAPHNAHETRAVFSEVAAALGASGAQIVQERVYGRLKVRAELLKIRADAYVRHGIDPLPQPTYLEGEPVHRGGFAGMQVWAARGGATGAPPVSSVGHPGGCRGRLWRRGGARFLSLSSVQGAAPGGRSSGAPAEQARRMFLNAADALGACGFSYSQVARTWIYLRRILDWYGGFNEARTGLYRSERFLGAERLAAPPASTGIGVRSSSGDCLMDVLAVQGDVELTPIQKTARQGSACSYGSTFSRALVLRAGRTRLLFVSGTASIDAAGRSTHKGDHLAQARDTLLNVAAVLEGQGASLESVASATLFCKDAEAFRAYRAVHAGVGASALPIVPMIADVCRPELLVEIEAVAVL